MVHIVVHGERQFGIAPVNRTAGGVGKVLDLVGPAGLQDVQEPHDIGVDVGARVFQAVAYAGLGGQVHDPVGLMAVENAPHGGSVLQARLFKGEVRKGEQAIEPGLLEGGVVVIVQVVDAHHLVAMGKANLGEVGADKAG